jgi:Endonuclease NucS
VVLFDETDCLVGRSMVSFLTQLREGYIDREDTPYPHSVVLIGQRQVRDDVLAQEDQRALHWLGSASPFNITAEAASIGPFTEPEVAELCGQHPLYREVIPRALSFEQQVQIVAEAAPFLRPDGGLDMARLLDAWQTFWREDGHLAAEGFGYRESGPHLMLMAFLQRVINGGGRVEREYGLGRGALDLLVEWRGARHAIEVKLRRDTETEAEAVEQVTRYLDAAGLDEGWLVMFDLRSTSPWEQRLTTRTVESNGKRVFIVGC